MSGLLLLVTESKQMSLAELATFSITAHGPRAAYGVYCLVITTRSVNQEIVADHAECIIHLTGRSGSTRTVLSSQPVLFFFGGSVGTVIMLSRYDQRFMAKIPVTLWMTTTAVTDILSLLSFLSGYNMKTSFKTTEHLIQRLMRPAMQTGSTTSVIALCVLISYLVNTQVTEDLEEGRDINTRSRQLPSNDDDGGMLLLADDGDDDDGGVGVALMWRCRTRHGPKRLGTGGSSHVYLAKQSPTQRTVAVKVIKKHGQRKTRNGVLRERHMQSAICPSFLGALSQVQDNDFKLEILN
ncbi:hypothetical protein BDZ89DRAFT_1196888 [Hymenopellis radicata]|nr:hypothetical protein BDZ89DRAFT_1196888 [Hymenopellis radicata]